MNLPSSNFNVTRMTVKQAAEVLASRAASRAVSRGRAKQADLDWRGMLNTLQNQAMTTFHANPIAASSLAGGAVGALGGGALGMRKDQNGERHPFRGALTGGIAGAGLGGGAALLAQHAKPAMTAINPLGAGNTPPDDNPQAMATKLNTLNADKALPQLLRSSEVHPLPEKILRMCGYGTPIAKGVYHVGDNLQRFARRVNHPENVTDAVRLKIQLRGIDKYELPNMGMDPLTVPTLAGLHDAELARLLKTVHTNPDPIAQDFSPHLNTFNQLAANAAVTEPGMKMRYRNLFDHGQGYEPEPSGGGFGSGAGWLGAMLPVLATGGYDFANAGRVGLTPAQMQQAAAYRNTLMQPVK